MLFGGETAYWLKMDGNILRQCSTFRRAGEEEYWKTTLLEWDNSVVVIYEAGVMAVDELLQVRWHTPKLLNDCFVNQMARILSSRETKTQFGLSAWSMEKLQFDFLTVPMNIAKQIILWLALAFACFLPASALTLTAPENRVWEIFSIGYDAATAEAIIGYDAPVRLTSEYDEGPIHHAGDERRFALGTCALFGPNAEFKAAEGGSTTFYTVQGAEDIARLKSGGTPWPSTPSRSALGEGVYSFDNLEKEKRGQE